PLRPDPLRPDPLRPDPLRPDPLRPDPLRPDPLRPDPLRPDPLWNVIPRRYPADRYRRRAVQCRAGPHRTARYRSAIVDQAAEFKPKKPHNRRLIAQRFG